jgi:hypothetical protein
MTAIDLEDTIAREEHDLELGWYAEMPEGTLAAYDEALDTTLRVVDRIADLHAAADPNDNI